MKIQSLMCGKLMIKKSWKKLTKLVRISRQSESRNLDKIKPQPIKSYRISPPVFETIIRFRNCSSFPSG